MQSEKETDKSTWAIGGGLLMGLGIGFFLLEKSVFAFIGSMIGGLGLGLMIASIISVLKEK